MLQLQPAHPILVEVAEIGRCVIIRVDIVNPTGATSMEGAKRPKGRPKLPATAAKLRAVRLELPEDIHKLLRKEAAEQDKSLGELARQFVTECLTKRKGGKP